MMVLGVLELGTWNLEKICRTNGELWRFLKLDDVNITAKEDVNEVKLKNQESTDVTDGQDEVSGTITDSIQAVVDTILFSLSTPSTTKSMDVRELQASKANAPAKRERKKFRVLRSPYISKYGSSSKNSINFDKEEKLKYAFDGYTVNQDLLNELMIDYSQWIVVGLLKTHSAKYTTTSCFFKSYVEKTHTRYYPAEPAVELSTQQDYVESIVVVKNKDSIANIIHGFCMSAGLPWYMVDEVYVPINCGKRISLAYKGKITQQTGLVNEIPFDVDNVQNIPQQVSDSLDCGIFVCANAEILSEGLQVHLCGFDAASQRACYASLLWHYGVEKANEGYTSDNGDPPRPKKSVIEEIEASAIVTLE
ncbi:hypothetical protein CQW23_13233 [Capsicum baccatum]|uniref:Ubiquitin-like protease family profile domain-containing protein n=1 Tax=Capsicum baccatum TaxID=33114 RepID=A0A2G2WUV7_CAPBA|nr:hypothetical protein CQW23_13233 [Capsicum baccatum]